MNFIGAILGFCVGLIVCAVLAVSFQSKDFKNGAIATTKGEYVCQYNDFADDWDCKEAL